MATCVLLFALLAYVQTVFSSYALYRAYRYALAIVSTILTFILAGCIGTKTVCVKAQKITKVTFAIAALIFASTLAIMIHLFALVERMKPTQIGPRLAGRLSISSLVLLAICAVFVLQVHRISKWHLLFAPFMFFWQHL